MSRLASGDLPVMSMQCGSMQNHRIVCQKKQKICFLMQYIIIKGR